MVSRPTAIPQNVIDMCRKHNPDPDPLPPGMPEAGFYLALGSTIGGLATARMVTGDEASEAMAAIVRLPNWQAAYKAIWGKEPPTSVSEGGKLW